MKFTLNYNHHGVDRNRASTMMKDLHLRDQETVPSGSMLALPDPRRPDRANPLTNFDDPFF